MIDFSQPLSDAAGLPMTRPASELRARLVAMGARRPAVLGETRRRLQSRATAAPLFLVGDRDGSSGARLWHGLHVVADPASGRSDVWSLPIDAGTVVHAALDLDRDGIDELLLRRESARMGIVRSDLVVWSLAGPAARRLLDEEAVAYDSCAAPLGDRFRACKRLTIHAIDQQPSLNADVEVRRRACRGCEDGHRRNGAAASAGDPTTETSTWRALKPAAGQGGW